MNDLAHSLTGRFIVLDGPDGAGKSTQLVRLADWLRGLGLTVAVARDPGGTPIGDRIRHILLDPAASEMDVTCELMLYMASRAQLLHEVVRPALQAGHCVLCDRFVSATIAYQGAGGANVADIQSVARVAVGRTWPDLTLILDVDPDIGLARLPAGLDRMEAKGMAFHRKVRELFLAEAHANADRFAVIDAAQDVEAVAEQIQQTLSEWQFRTSW